MKDSFYRLHLQVKKPRLRDVRKSISIDLGNPNETGGLQSWDANPRPSETCTPALQRAAYWRLPVLGTVLGKRQSSGQMTLHRFFCLLVGFIGAESSADRLLV